MRGIFGKAAELLAAEGGAELDVRGYKTAVRGTACG